MMKPSDDVIRNLLPGDMSPRAADEMMMNIGRVINSLEDGGLSKILLEKDFPNMLVAVSVLLLMRLNGSDGSGGMSPDKIRAYTGKDSFAEDILSFSSWLGAIIQVWVPDHIDEIKR